MPFSFAMVLFAAIIVLMCFVIGFVLAQAKRKTSLADSAATVAGASADSES